MNEIKKPKTITLRCCPKCKGCQSWSVHGFAYPAGDHFKWSCYMCDYKGKPHYQRYMIKLSI